VVVACTGTVLARAGAARKTLEAFVAALGTRGFSTCATSAVEPGHEKIALYAQEATPTHVARQLRNGWWTSKLGPSFDIEHVDLRAVAGGVYGDPVVFLARKPT
jgi:hypothetical protein